MKSVFYIRLVVAGVGDSTTSGISGNQIGSSNLSGVVYMFIRRNGSWNSKLGRWWWLGEDIWFKRRR